MGGAGFVSSLSAAPWGGSEALWHAAARRLLAQGLPVTTITRRWNRPPQPISELAQLGARTRTWTPAGRVRRVFYKSGLGLHRRLALDVVVLNMASTTDLVNAPAVRAQLRAARNERIPYIMAPHSLIERRLTPYNRAFLRSAYEHSEAVVLPSARLHADLERQLAARLPRCVEIATPTPLLDDAPWAPPSPSEVLRLACVGRLEVEQKGQDVLLAALAGAPWSERSWHLDLYGDGPDDGYLRELVALYGLQAKVTLRGHTSDIASVWRDHDVLVAPSRREARGIAITEAMACGRPVVATAVGGIPDSVRDGVTGLLAPAASQDSLADTLERLWSRRTRLYHWGRAAQDHVRALFATDPVDRLADLIQEVSKAR